MRQAYPHKQQLNGSHMAAFEPLKSRSELAQYEVQLADLDEAVVAKLEAIRDQYELPNLDAAAQMLLAQRLQKHARGRA